MSKYRQRPCPLSPLIFDDPEAIEEFATIIYDLHEAIAKKGACYEVSLSEALREITLGRIKGALASVFCSYFGRTPHDRFSDIFDQLSGLAEHLAKDHVFEDGNKRTSLLLVFIILGTRRIKVVFDDSPDPKRNPYYQWIQDLVSGARSRDELADDLRSNAVIVEPDSDE